jgi:NADH:ubiquinone oxidoreductase subunit K
MVPIAYYLVLSAVLFSIGVAAFLIKRNIITVFMSKLLEWRELLLPLLLRRFERRT